MMGSLDVGDFITGLLIAMLVGIFIKMQRTAKQVDDLHTWHSMKDEDGVFVWYVRKSFESAIDKLADSMADLSIVLTKIHQEQQSMHKDIVNLRQNRKTDAT